MKRYLRRLAAAGAIATGIAAAVISASRRRAAGREERVDGEVNFAKDVAGRVFTVAGDGAAVLVGDAVVECGHEKLGVALQADNRELANGDVQAFSFAAENQLIIEAATDGAGKIDQLAVGAAAVADIENLAGQNNGIDNFHNSLGKVALHHGSGIRVH